MDALLPDQELEELEQIPLEERVTALEVLERRLRSYMDAGPSSNEHDPKE